MPIEAPNPFGPDHDLEGLMIDRQASHIANLLTSKDSRKRRQGKHQLRMLRERYEDPEIHDGGAGGVLARLLGRGIIKEMHETEDGEW